MSDGRWPVSTRTRAPERPLPAELLDELGVDVDSNGVIFGFDRERRPVRLRLFGPQPVTVASVGRPWVAQVLVLRSLAHGAVVAVEAIDTSTPARLGTAAGRAGWLALDRAAGGTGDRVLPRPADLAGLPASAAAPLLVVHDIGPTGTYRPPVPRAWQARLTVLNKLRPVAVPTLVSADIVLVQRMDAADVELLESAVPLPPDLVSLLPAMSDEMLVAFENGQFRYLWLTLTSVERRLLARG